MPEWLNGLVLKTSVSARAPEVRILPLPPILCRDFLKIIKTQESLLMEIDQFLKANNLKLSEKIFHLCSEGLKRMKNTKDPLHDDQHIYRLISNLNDLIQAEKPAMNVEIIMTAICWHDVWKSTRFPSIITSVVFDQYWDGYGSAYIFKKAARRVGLNNKISNKIYYAIREHGRLRFSKTKTTEAKILQDVDGLDEWYLGRIEPLKTKYLITKHPNRRLLRMAKFYFDHFMSNQSPKKFYFNWSKTEFTERKKTYLSEVNRLIEQHGSLIE